MDTPLYVLSTAASMVESVDINGFKSVESACLKRSIDQDSLPRKSPPHQSPPCEPPPKYHDLQPRKTAASRTCDTEQSSEDTKRCTGTQTSFTSFGGYPGVGAPSSEKYIKTNDGTFARRSPSEWSPPPPYYSHHLAAAPAPYPPRYGNPNIKHEEMETDSMPLNLTTSSSSHQSNQNRSSPPSSKRPSVITRGINGGTLPEDRSHRLPSYSSGRGSPVSPAMSTGSNGTRPDSQTDVCDPEIEEHFRRSLGTKYPEYIRPQSRGSVKNDSSHNKNHNVSITGNVDDHFAKSLGDAWTKLNPPQKKKSNDDLLGSVDDHFAKALGSDTWFKIKAQKEQGQSEIKPLSSGTRPHSSTVH